MHSHAFPRLALAVTIMAACDTPPKPTAPTALSAQVAALDPTTSTPFGTFNGIAYTRRRGFFEGQTSLGAFRVPYEIITPADPALGNGTLLVEPPHFAFGAAGRDIALGRSFLFGRGFSYATVGFGGHGLNILDPTAAGLVLAGAPVARPGAFNPFATLDEEIVAQFTDAVSAELGVDRRYAFGISQTAAVLLELQRNLAATGRAGLFDLTVLYVALWHEPFFGDAGFQFVRGEFEPLAGVGRVLFVESEGDQVVSDAETFRRAAGLSGYRVYEVAGAAHVPTADNPLDHAPVVRALFVAGDAWVRSGTEPPPSTLLDAAPAGEVDPAYGRVTGIARDGGLNARGGVRLPDLALGRARFIASDPTTLGPGIPPLFAILTGNMVDLACQRFGHHGEYVRAVARQATDLQRQGFLLDADAEALRQRAAESPVGASGTCA